MLWSMIAGMTSFTCRITGIAPSDAKAAATVWFGARNRTPFRSRGSTIRLLVVWISSSSHFGISAGRCLGEGHVELAEGLGGGSGRGDRGFRAVWVVAW